MRKLFRREEGATAPEYIGIVALVFGALVAGLGLFTDVLSDVMTFITDALNSVIGS